MVRNPPSIYNTDIPHIKLLLESFFDLNHRNLFKKSTKRIMLEGREKQKEKKRVKNKENEKRQRGFNPSQGNKGRSDGLLHSGFALRPRGNTHLA